MDVTFLLIFILGLSTTLNVFVGAQVTGSNIVASCTGDAMILMCPPGSNITVLEALYGYTLSTDNNCAEGSIPECNLNLPTGIQLSCDSRETCSFFTESRFVPQWFGCPSNRTNKLIVTYTCSGMTITTTATTTETKMQGKHGNIARSRCEGDVMVLMCPPGYHITVLEALYGYTISTDNNCSVGSIPECNRNLPFTSSIICNNRKSCRFITERRHVPQGFGCPSNWTNSLMITYTCSGMTITTSTTTIASSSSPATNTVAPTYHHTSPVLTTCTQETTATETVEQGNPKISLPVSSSITSTNTRGTTISTLGSTVTTRTPTSNLRIDGIQCAVIGGTLGAISLVLLILNIAAICYIFRMRRFQKAQSSHYSDQTNRDQADREGRENVYAQLGEQEPQQQYSELELQRRGTQFYEKIEGQYVNQGFQMGVADSQDI